jgi:glucosamine kinase
MIAVVYSGSHYAQWRLADKEKTVASFRTNGINPHFSDQKSIVQLLGKNINLIHHAEEIKRIYFFGAGTTKEFGKVVADALSAFFINSKVTVQHDMVGAAIACCKNTPGIVTICGSGSNAAWYDGKKLKPNNYGLGYILADEGSANWLGRQLIKGFMEGTMPENLRKKFAKKYEVDRGILLEKVYRQKQPTLYLSSFTDFYLDNQQDKYLQNVIIKGFSKLINTYCVPLHKQHPEAVVHFTGSIAANFQHYLRHAAAEADIKVGNIIHEPINNLLTYYINRN